MKGEQKMFFNRAKRRAKLKARAEKEYEVVRVCTVRIGENLNKVLVERASLMSEAEAKRAEILRRDEAGEDEFTLNAMAQSYEIVLGKLKTSEVSLQIVQNTYRAIAELEAIVQSVMRLEGYKYIIKMIPEKELPDLIQSFENGSITQITYMIKEISNKIYDRMVSSLENADEIEKFKHNIELVTAERTRGFSNSSPTSALDRLRAESRKNDMPLPNTADNTIKATNTNKA